MIIEWLDGVATPAFAGFAEKLNEVLATRKNHNAKAG